MAKKKKKKEATVESDENYSFKVKPGTCWFCVYGNEPLKDSTRCKKCISGTKNGFKKAGKRIMKQREEDL